MDSADKLLFTISIMILVATIALIISDGMGIHGTTKATCLQQQQYEYEHCIKLLTE